MAAKPQINILKKTHSHIVAHSFFSKKYNSYVQLCGYVFFKLLLF